MCSHYQALKERDKLARMLRLDPEELGPIPDVNTDLWPRKTGLFLRKNEAGTMEAVAGRWGIIPWSTKPEGLAKAEKLSTFNARSETVATSYTFRGAWKRGQRCIVPAVALYEPDWRSGKAVPTRFKRRDGQPLGVAGLWDRYITEDGEVIESYTMLTINADQHSMFQNYHRPENEKRMVVILPEDLYLPWLDASVDEAAEFIASYPAERLETEAIK